MALAECGVLAECAGRLQGAGGVGRVRGVGKVRGRLQSAGAFAWCAGRWHLPPKTLLRRPPYAGAGHFAWIFIQFAKCDCL